MILEVVCLGFAFYCFMNDRGLPIPTLILFSFAGAGIFVLQKLPLGRYIYAIGGNEEASHLSGIPVKKVKWTVYAFMGFLAGTCGALLAARLNSAAPTEGQLMELDAIAAVVIGGTSLMGGLGTIGGSLIGAFLIGTLNNGMDILEVDSNYQMVIKGIIIIFAVWFDARQKQKATK
jgi:ABC-type xylose transport system permease subunit